MCAELATLPGGHVVVALSGEIDMLTAPAVRETLAEATRRAVTGVIIDLAGVTFLDAAGLGVLAGASGRARRLPDGLRLAAVPPRARRLLTLAGLDRHLAVFPAPPDRGQSGDESRAEARHDWLRSSIVWHNDRCAMPAGGTAGRAELFWTLTAHDS